MLHGLFGLGPALARLWRSLENGQASSVGLARCTAGARGSRGGEAGPIGSRSPEPDAEPEASVVPREEVLMALRSSSCGMSHDARNAMRAIGAAMMNTVWIDSAYAAAMP